MATRLLIGSEVLDPDVVISEQFFSVAVVTSHPVEQGANVSDHVQEQPLQVQLQFVVSDTPLRLPSFGAGSVGVESQAPLFLLTGTLDDRARQLADRLKATRARGELVTLDSARRGTITNLAVQSVDEPYSSLRGVTLQVGLVQIRVADARTVAIPPALQERGKKKKDKGKQPTETPTATRSRSLLTKLADSI